MSANRYVIYSLVALFVIILASFLYLTIKSNRLPENLLRLNLRIPTGGLTTESEISGYSIDVRDKTLNGTLVNLNKNMKVILTRSVVEGGNRVIVGGNLIAASRVETNISTNQINLYIYLSPDTVSNLDSSSILISDYSMEVIEKLKNPRLNYEQSETKQYIRDNANNIEKLPFIIRRK